MKLADIKTKSDKELALALDETRQQLAQVRVDMRTKQVKNVKEIKSVRKRLAQILTLQKMRELTAEATTTAAATNTTKEDK